MAISNNSRGMQPGICTSTTRPTAPYEGQMIYETDTDLTYIWNGTAFYQVSGSTAVGNSGLVFVKSQTIGSGVSSVTVTDAFSATFDNYVIQTTGIVSSVPANFGLQLGSTTTGYYYFLNYQIAAIAGGAFFQALNTNFFGYLGAITPAGSSTHMEIFNPFATARTAARGAYLEFATNGSCGGMTGWLDNATSYTSFQLRPGTGTITGGTITVYGYRKA